MATGLFAAAPLFSRCNLSRIQVIMNIYGSLLSTSYILLHAILFIFITYGNFLKKSHVDMLHIKIFKVKTFTHHRRINPTKDELLNAELKTDAELA